MKLAVGSDVIGSYRRLPYKVWYAIVGSVDNSSQFYFDHMEELNNAYTREGKRLTIGTVYGDGILCVSDNATGMPDADIEKPCTFCVDTS